MSRASLAGTLALASLAIPLDVAFFRGGFALSWTVFGVDFLSSRILTFNVTQYHFLDAALSILLLIVVLVGGALLLSNQGKPRSGDRLLILGVLLYLIDLAYDEVAFRGSSFPIPLGFLVLLAAAVTGFLAKPVVAIAASAVMPQQMLSSADVLIKLKGLLDSGAITKEEFEEQKRKILAG